MPNNLDPYESDTSYFHRMIESAYADYITVISPCLSERALYLPVCYRETPFYPQMEACVREFFQCAKFKKCLDCGCGVGRLSLFTANCGIDVIAIDKSRTLIDFCNKLLVTQGATEVEIPSIHTGRSAILTIPQDFSGTGAVFQVGSADDIQYPDEEFDCIISSNVIDRVTDPLLVVQEMNRVLKYGGRILLSSPLDWRTQFTPDVSLWQDSLTALSDYVGWHVIHNIPCLEYKLRLSDRAAVHYKCEVIVAEKS